MPRRRAAGDRYELDAHGVKLRGMHGGRSYALGDRVRLRIEDVSLAQRKVLAAPAETPFGGAGVSGRAPWSQPTRRGVPGERTESRHASARAKRAADVAGQTPQAATLSRIALNSNQRLRPAQPR